jgi:hypothetical protein
MTPMLNDETLLNEGCAEIIQAANGIVFFKMAHFCFEIGFFDDSKSNFMRSLELFNSISDQYKLKFFNLFQEAFNCLGIMEYN